jgi:MFS family permease
MMVIFCSGISCGYGLAYTNNTMPVINAIYGWDDDASKYKWDSLIGCIFTLGAGIGATSAGKII